MKSICAIARLIMVTLWPRNGFFGQNPGGGKHCNLSLMASHCHCLGHT